MELCSWNMFVMYLLKNINVTLWDNRNLSCHRSKHHVEMKAPGVIVFSQAMETHVLWAGIRYISTLTSLTDDTCVYLHVSCLMKVMKNQVLFFVIIVKANIICEMIFDDE